VLLGAMASYLPYGISESAPRRLSLVEARQDTRGDQRTVLLCTPLLGSLSVASTSVRIQSDRGCAARAVESRRCAVAAGYMVCWERSGEEEQPSVQGQSKTARRMRPMFARNRKTMVIQSS